MNNDANTTFFKSFRRYGEIQQWLRSLVDKYSNIARLEIIGKSLQNRDIYMIVLRGCRDETKISLMLEGGIHAREWISHATVLYFVYHVLLNQEILEQADIYAIPCLNPDGYEYTHTKARLWRKNMNNNGSESTEFWGVDLNRNFPHAYGLPGSSSSPTNSKYRGLHCLSEPEAQCLANVMSKYGRDIQLFVAMHAGGNKIMYPWGFTTVPVLDERELKKCAQNAADAIRSVFPNSCYQVGQLSDILYLSSGGSSDFVRGVYKIKYSYTVELHRSGPSGFEPCVDEIVPEGEEMVLALKAMVKHVHNYYNCKRKHKKREEAQLAQRASG